MADFDVWCQGGPADGYRYQMSVPPPDEITLWRPYPHPWRRVVAADHWPDAVTYVCVERLDDQCIYHLKGLEGLDLGLGPDDEGIDLGGEGGLGGG